MAQYGVFIGRFQPLHLGHMSIINHIMVDGRNPLILIGRPSLKVDGATIEKYPLDFNQTAEQFELVYGDTVQVEPIYDYPENDNTWMIKVLSVIENNAGIEDSVLYYTKKPEDLNTDGKHYSDMFSPYIDMKKSSYPSKLNIAVSATDIRKDISNNAHYLDGRIYHHVRGKFKNSI